MSETSTRSPRIHFEAQGSGEPALLFLPGWCSGSRVFDALFSRCAASHRAIRIDWWGHGRSAPVEADFGFDALVADAAAVIEATAARSVVPVALSHAGWVALELRRRLGARIPKLVLLDWLVLDPPPPFLDTLDAFQDPRRWQPARDQLFERWRNGTEIPALNTFLREDMGGFDFAMWSRAGREIAAAYARAGNPLRALAALAPPVPTLHLYAQPADPGYYAAQEHFASTHPWFSVRRLAARSHFPMFEAPEAMTDVIHAFIDNPPRPKR